METALKIIAIGLGGSAGAVARYLINISPLADIFSKFPLATLVINVTGSFMIGFLLIVFADKYLVSEALRMAVIVGFLGAFTTFSTFEMEIYGLLRDGSMTTGVLYLLLSVILGFVGVVCGVAAGRSV